MIHHRRHHAQTRRVGVRSECLGHSWRAWVGQFWRAPKYPDQELVLGAFVRLEISDSGAGVSSELAARVFDPFFTTKFIGRGLGLSEVQGKMRAHGGGVRLDTSSARGARVQAVFPADVSNLR